MKKVKGEMELKNLPYTVVGHSAIPPPILSILLTAEGIISIASKVKAGDLIRIEQWSDYNNECEDKRHYGRITVIPGEKK